MISLVVKQVLGLAKVCQALRTKLFTNVGCMALSDCDLLMTA